MAKVWSTNQNNSKKKQQQQQQKSTSDLTKDVDEEEFMNFRVYCCDTFVSCYYILRKSYLDICQLLMNQFESSRQLEERWNKLEAVFTAFSAVAEACSRDSDHPVIASFLSCINSIPQLPPPQVESAIFKMIGLTIRFIHSFILFYVLLKLPPFFFLISCLCLLVFGPDKGNFRRYNEIYCR